MNIINKLISTYELTPIEGLEESIFGNLKFTLQIFQDSEGMYFPKILREDLYTLDHLDISRSINGKVSFNKVTVKLMVPDSLISSQDLIAATEDAVIQLVLAKIRETFSLPDS